MGHYFISVGGSPFSGVQLDGEFVVVRRDLFLPAIQALYDSICKADGDDNLKWMTSVASRLLYPSAYLSSADAILHHREQYLLERAVHQLFLPNFREDFANFNTGDLDEVLISEELITGLLEIFLTNSRELIHEALPGSSVIRIARRPSKLLSLFSTSKGGDTIYSFDARSVDEISCSPKQIQFFSGGHNFMTLRRDRCYY